MDNDLRYKQLKISVASDIVADFKKSCAASNISMAAKLCEFMVDFTGGATNRKPLPDYTTKRKRREAIRIILEQLEQIRDAEQQYQDRIPENLQGSVVYDCSEAFVGSLDDAIDALAEAE
jgi:hypothetical protein